MSMPTPDPVELDRRLTAEADRLIPATEQTIQDVGRTIEQNERHLQRHPRRSHMSPASDESTKPN